MSRIPVIDIGIEDSVWLQVGDSDKIRPIADEDLERSDEEKTLRFISCGSNSMIRKSKR